MVTNGLKQPTTSHSLEKPDRCVQVGYMSVTRFSPSPERVWPARLGVPGECGAVELEQKTVD